MTYRTAGPQYQQVLRTSLEPVLADFEAVWSAAWLPRGTKIRFHRAQLLREDLSTSMSAAVAGKNAGIISLPEARVMVGVPPTEGGTIGTGADVGGDPDENLPAPAPADDTTDEPGDTTSD
jgi:hypothetical protein